EREAPVCSSKRSRACLSTIGGADAKASAILVKWATISAFLDIDLRKELRNLTRREIGCPPTLDRNSTFCSCRDQRAAPFASCPPKSRGTNAESRPQGARSASLSR